MPHILELPVEVLQLVASHPVDLAVLRLVCKDFNAAFLDAYGREYIRDLQCFPLDIRRIQRLKSMTGQPHLAKRIHSVTITFDVLEGKNPVDIPAVFEKDEQSSHSYLLGREYAKRAAKTFSNRVPDLKNLKLALENLRAAGRPLLNLNFWHYTSTKIEDHLCLTQNEVAAIFEVVLASGCTLSTLSVQQSSFLEAAHSDGRHSRFDRFMRLGESLKELNIDMLAETQDWALIAMMKGATNLQTFSLAHAEMFQDLDLFDHNDYRPYLARSNAFLSASPTAIREVRLWSVGLHTSTLLAALWSWRHTLQDLAMCFVYLTSRGNDWLEVFRYLESSVDSLEDFRAMGLMEQSRGIRLIDEERFQGRVVLLDLKGRPGLDIWLRGRQKIQQGLRMNVAAGMSETRWKTGWVESEDQ